MLNNETIILILQIVSSSGFYGVDNVNMNMLVRKGIDDHSIYSVYIQLSFCQFDVGCILVSLILVFNYSLCE